MNLKVGVCGWCGQPAEWLICDDCKRRAYEHQKSITETFLDVSRTEEWRNELLEEHSEAYVKELDKKIDDLSGGVTE